MTTQVRHAMRAVIRDEDGIALGFVPVPLAGRDEVVIDVAYAGVCRSDLAVADGRIAVSAGRVLGHELAGRVRELGEGVSGLAVGDPVSAIPFGEDATGATWWLGIDVDGGFAEQVRVPARCVLRLPVAMPLVLGAYVEPVAAALGLLPRIAPGAHVRIDSRGRIAEVAARVIAAHGGVVSRGAGAGDTVIELEALVNDPAARRGSYGSFDEAIAWLNARRIAVDDLIAHPLPLAAFTQVFAAVRAGDAANQTFAITERH
jgi:threonine dehydrogenase-like Zn-dependent dehydrogenase